MKSSVKAHTPGDYCAPYQGGFASFLVEDRGVIVVNATGAVASVIAFHFAAMRAYEHDHLGNVIGSFALGGTRKVDG